MLNNKQFIQNHVCNRATKEVSIWLDLALLQWELEASNLMWAPLVHSS